MRTPWAVEMMVAGACSLIFFGCYQHHGSGGEDAGIRGERCGSLSCALGEVCCNASCEICTPPGGSCIAVICEPSDLEPPDASSVCGDRSCLSGELCCPSCPGAPPECIAARSCPRLACPPPSDAGLCGSCPAGMACCDACPGDPPLCLPSGSPCPDLLCPPPPSTPCTGRSYCECVDGTEACEPLIDLFSGCICPCDEPFNCSGMDCVCDCGGARYLGCAPAGRCVQTELSCACPPAIDASGCPFCPECGGPDAGTSG